MTSPYSPGFGDGDVFDAPSSFTRVVGGRAFWRGAVAATVIGIAGAVAVELVVVTPIATERDGRLAAGAAVAAENRANEAVLVGYEAFLREKGDVDRRFEAAISAVPTDAEMASVLDSIGALAAQARMHLVSFTPDVQKPPSGAPLEPRSARFLVRGGFDQLKTFVRSLGDYPRLLTIESISVKTSAKEGYTLEAAVAITCYFKKTPIAAT
jgi:Tfp pilus assembly protein PilO